MSTSTLLAPSPSIPALAVPALAAQTRPTRTGPSRTGPGARTSLAAGVRVTTAVAEVGASSPTHLPTRAAWAAWPTQAS